MTVVADRTHRRAQERLADATARMLQGVILSLPDPDADDALERYSPQAARIVGGGQERSARFAIAYVEKLSPSDPGKSPPTTARALTGVLVNESSPVARSPILRLKARLAEGIDLPTAQAEAASYSRALATGDLQAAERGGLAEGARAGDRPVRGWRKVLSTEPCQWCVTVASETSGRYRSPDSVPFHERDRCGVAPVFQKGEVE